LGGFAIVAFACNDELTEEVPKEVCYSQMRWVGEKRGSPEMFPGRDCVGCHIDNDGPPLAIGGTLYAYVLAAPDVLGAQTGEDCYGIEGTVVTVTDANGQEFNLTTNRAGNFYVEGNPEDFAKPFKVSINAWTFNDDGTPVDSSMGTSPMYGGCARCHDPQVPSAITAGLEYDTTPADADYRNGVARIGLPGNPSDVEGFETIVDELRSFLPAAAE
jgi:hypothetical protein